MASVKPLHPNTAKQVYQNTPSTPQPSTAVEESSSIPSGYSAKAVANRGRGARVYIEPPILSAEERKKFIPANLSDSESEEITLEEVVGEYELNSERYLYARWSDGVYRKKRAWEIKAAYPDLYDDYEERKRAGNLEDFDPSGTSVHPRDRVGFLLHIDTRQLNRAHSRRRHRTRGSSSSLTPLSSDESEDYFESKDDRSSIPRRNIRRTVRGATDMRDLPFSPRKTRALGRVSRKTRHFLDSDFEEISSDATSKSDASELSFQKPLTKRVRRRKVRPLYGQVQKAEDLWDPYNDMEYLRAHRTVCEKCHHAPAHILLKEKPPKRRKSSKHHEDDYIDETKHAQDLGGWVQCLKCCVAVHWKCLAKTERDDILRAIRQKDADLLEGDQESQKRTGLPVEESTSYICGWCSKGGKCLACGEIAIQPEPSAESHQSSGQFPTLVQDPPVDSLTVTTSIEDASHKELLFRCNTCKRLAHYHHLDVPEGEDLSSSEKARYYQEEQGWLCADCNSYTYSLDKILAWRPSSSEASHLTSPRLDPVNYRDDLPREYLVKWTGRSYLRTTWVPHMWLLSTHSQKLKNFVLSGSDVEFGPVVSVDNPNVKGTVIEAKQAQSPKSPSTRVSTKILPHSLAPLPDAQERIPSAWKTVDRVLDVLLWRPQKRFSGSKNRNKGRKNRKNVQSRSLSSSSEIGKLGLLEQYQQIIDVGDQPNDNLTETIDEWEDRTGETFSIEQIHLVVWAFLKWDDLPYNDVTWDSPPQPGDPGFTAYESALSRFIMSREVLVYRMSDAQAIAFERRGRTKWKASTLGIPDDNGYDIGQDKSLMLMDFQVVGVNWLCRNWYQHQQCILADEMGLGKTVQIVTFIGLLLERSVFPSLVVVPNSTITNWVREFERWAPRLRVVPFHGDARARDIIKQYELFHEITAPGTTGGKFHVLVTTYEMVINAREFNAVFKRMPRWELLVVDEGQRLKNDSSLLFRKLNELNTIHRIIMTGTPLNNNIRELFNLMNFLDPDKWDDLNALEKQYEELTDDLVKELHEKLRPYFLRRVKAEVLKLPPKNEVIVPLSMAPLQKEIYKSILSQNLEILRSFTQTSFMQHRSSAIKKSTTHNILMQLRKTLQHPYLVADDIEPKGLSQAEAHVKLIDASSKLQFLKLLLPKLKSRGHPLDILEDFLIEEGLKFLRLDGNTKQSERQARMDEFNRVNSDVFIFILSTRAGGVGINLWSADTVIIFDPDYNPHQDLQAIARAHRYGQQKLCLVFKLMVKESAEDKIMQMGKKKLVLDHLIVQKMDDEDTPEDIQSILTFGAQALFQENQTSKDITYSDQDVDQLIDKTEKDEPTQDVDGEKPSFSFARIWHAEIDGLEDFSDTTNTPQNESDSWAQTLDKIAIERARTKAVEVSGRGARRKAAELKVTYYEPSPEKVKKKRRSRSASSLASDKDYVAPEYLNSDSEYSDHAAPSSANPGREDTLPDLDLHRTHLHASSSSERIVVGASISAVHNSSAPPMASPERHRTNDTLGLEWGSCGLCDMNHPDGQCDMTRNSINLSEYRKILMENNDEPWEIRKRAIAAIDATLKERGHLNLTSGQPKFKLKSSQKSKINKKSGKRHDPPPMQPLMTTVPGFVDGVDNVLGFHATSSGSQNRYSDSDFLIPSADQPPSKKTKLMFTCEICHNNPYHVPEQCPRVQGGSESILTAIMKLQSRGGRKETIVALRELMGRQKAAEAARASAGLETAQL